MTYKSNSTGNARKLAEKNLSCLVIGSWQIARFSLIGGEILQRFLDAIASLEPGLVSHSLSHSLTHRNQISGISQNSGLSWAKLD